MTPLEPTTAAPAPGDALDGSGPDDPVDDRPGDDEGKAPRSRSRSIVEWVAVIGGALLVALVIKTFLIQAFYIPSGSMEPTLEIGDRVLVNKLSYRVHDVNRGDLVVFERDEAEEGEIRDLIKRVIALPGETVEGRDGHVVVDGRRVDEPYLAEEILTDDFGPVTVPAGHVFVMGDNRGNSSDSRVIGTIEIDTIVGRAIARIWPPDRAAFL